MVRVVKAPEVRKAEILTVANNLFKNKGYTKTSVDEIVRQAGIAKGTFYHYFKTKEDILAQLTEQLMTNMLSLAQPIMDDPNLDPIDKLIAIIASQKQLQNQQQDTIDYLHLPENKILHGQINIKIVLKLSPILADVIEQGNQQGLFQVDDPLSTIEFILAGANTLFDLNSFQWQADQINIKMKAMVVLIERALSAKPNSILAKLMPYLV